MESIRIKRARPEKRLPVVFSREEVAKIIDVTTNLKHRSIISMTYSAGLRLNEVRNLKLGDIDSDRMQVKISLGKGKKDRYSILAQSSLELLRQYYRKYHPKYYLFPGYDPDRIHRVAISNERITHVADHKISFRVKDYRANSIVRNMERNCPDSPTDESFCIKFWSVFLIGQCL